MKVGTRHLFSYLWLKLWNVFTVSDMANFWKNYSVNYLNKTLLFLTWNIFCFVGSTKVYNCNATLDTYQNSYVHIYWWSLLFRTCILQTNHWIQLFRRQLYCDIFYTSPVNLPSQWQGQNSSSQYQPFGLWQSEAVTYVGSFWGQRSVHN